MNENIDQIIEAYAVFEKHIIKFRDKGTKLSARKARKALLTMVKVGKVLRKQIQERKHKQKYIIKYEIPQL